MPLQVLNDGLFGHSFVGHSLVGLPEQAHCSLVGPALDGLLGNSHIWFMWHSLYNLSGTYVMVPWALILGHSDDGLLGHSYCGFVRHSPQNYQRGSRIMLFYGTILYLHGLSKHAQKGLVGQKMVYQDSYRGRTIIAV